MRLFKHKGNERFRKIRANRYHNPPFLYECYLDDGRLIFIEYDLEISEFRGYWIPGKVPLDPARVIEIPPTDSEYKLITMMLL